MTFEQFGKLKIGDTVYWRGSRVAAYQGRVIVILPSLIEAAVACNENGLVYWKMSDQIFVPPVKRGGDDE